jgi:hypothetical protein
VDPGGDYPGERLNGERSARGRSIAQVPITRRGHPRSGRPGVGLLSCDESGGEAEKAKDDPPALVSGGCCVEPWATNNDRSHFPYLPAFGLTLATSESVFKSER